MLIFPAIDIYGGRCVRLRRGDYNDCVVYADAPEEVAVRLARDGRRFLHVVDLDGARRGTTTNHATIAAILRLADVRVQIGGGVRTMEDIDRLLSLGAERVIVGSVAARDPDLLALMVSRFGGRHVAVGIDLRESRVAVDGWSGVIEGSAEQTIGRVVDSGAAVIICTDIARDGMMQGPNVELYRRLGLIFPGVEWIASGGVSQADDLLALRRAGVAGAIVGTAWYEGRITLEQMREAERI